MESWLNSDDQHEDATENTDGNDTDEEDFARPPEEFDDWMLLCRLNQNYQQVGYESDSTVDWCEDARSVAPDFLRECGGWIHSKRKDSEQSTCNNISVRTANCEEQINLSTLNDKQRLAFDLVLDHANSDNQLEPLRMIVCGTAGTGKTYLINALKQVLCSQCMLTATTGIAAFNIGGQTLHSAAQLPIREYRDLQGDSLHRLQMKLDGKSYIIIDEMSMMGHRMLSWLDDRLRAGTGHQDKPFGGLSIILLGDFGQLPPVGDRPMYKAGSGSRASDHGHMLYSSFNTVVILDQVMRQVGESATAFRALLMRMRDGNVTEDDWQLLLQHSTTNVDMSNFSNAIRLFFDRKSVAEYNFEKLRQNQQPIAKIQAKNSGAGASAATSDVAGGLEAVLYLAKKAEVMLTSNLWAEVGLCNGSFGVVEQFWFAENLGPPNLPICIIVHFPGYTGPQCFPNCEKCVPVPPKVFDWVEDGKYLTRQQVPLRLR